MDELDRKILAQLRVNARASLKHIGNEVGLSSPAIAQRIAKMEEEGIIEGYKVVLDASKIGYKTRALISVRLAQGQYKFLLKTVREQEGVTSCQRVTGEDCVVIQANFPDNEALTNFLDRLSNFGTTKTSIILEEFNWY